MLNVVSKCLNETAFVDIDIISFLFMNLAWRSYCKIHITMCTLQVTYHWSDRNWTKMKTTATYSKSNAELFKSKTLWTNQLIPWNQVLLEKLIVTHLVVKFPILYGTQRSITVWALSSARWIQSTPSHHI